ncbi:MAG TPA: Rieske 2Fe-2S domain-containing protein [Planctomycetota bacterium]|nr:Rieske 2Fe-2S domain-containing protein [Planctomycetota bacterium]
MDLDRREFLVACAACALSWNAAGCAAVNPVPLVEADAEGRVSVAGRLDKPGDQIKVNLPDSPDLVLVWAGAKGFGAASITCTHRGSQVHFNPAEGTLDCPSHGSRFDENGQVLHGPANRPLVPYRVQVDDGLLRVRRA